MPRILRAIRKKRNQSCLKVVVLLFIIALEIFSHAHDGAEILVAQLALPEKTSCQVNQNKIETEAVNEQTSCEQGSQKQNHNQPFSASGEASHHQVLTSPVFSHQFQAISIECESIAFRSAEPLHNSLPPPYTPPKFS